MLGRKKHGYDNSRHLLSPQRCEVGERTAAMRVGKHRQAPTLWSAAEA